MSKKSAGIKATMSNFNFSKGSWYSMTYLFFVPDSWHRTAKALGNCFVVQKEPLSPHKRL